VSVAVAVGAAVSVATGWDVAVDSWATDCRVGVGVVALPAQDTSNNTARIAHNAFDIRSLLERQRNWS
jgi:hypothetical protein